MNRNEALAEIEEAYKGLGYDAEKTLNRMIDLHEPELDALSHGESLDETGTKLFRRSLSIDVSNDQSLRAYGETLKEGE